MKALVKKMMNLQAEVEETIEKRTDQFDSHSERWQESEKGEEFQEKTDGLNDFLEALNVCLELLSDGL